MQVFPPTVEPYHLLTDRARHPNGGLCEVYVSDERLKMMDFHSEAAAKELRQIVPQILDGPEETVPIGKLGIERAFGRWYSYGYPECSFGDARGHRYRPYTNQVFWVYVRIQDDLNVASLWNWQMEREFRKYLTELRSQ